MSQKQLWRDFLQPSHRSIFECFDIEMEFGVDEGLFINNKQTRDLKKDSFHKLALNILSLTCFIREDIGSYEARQLAGAAQDWFLHQWQAEEGESNASRSLLGDALSNMMELASKEKLGFYEDRTWSAKVIRFWLCFH